MSLLDNLLRGHRRRCEERHRRLADLEELAQRLRADADRLREAIDAGIIDQVAMGQVVLRHATVERSIAAIEIQIGSAAAALLMAEAELKQSERAVMRRNGAAGPTDARGKRRGRRRQPPSRPDLGRDRGG